MTDTLLPVAAPSLADARRLAEEIAVDDTRVGRVLAFGSVARGAAGRGSDLDLVVLVAEDYDGDTLQALVDLPGEVRRRCGWHCDVIARTQQQWDHLVANVSASFEAAISAEATEVFSRGHSSRGFGARANGRLEDVARDNLDIATERLESSTQKLFNIENNLRGIRRAESVVMPQIIAAGGTIEHRRLQRYGDLLTESHLAIELAAKSVVASEGTPPRKSHQIDDLIAAVQDKPSRDALMDAVREAREDDGSLRDWRTGFYDVATDDVRNAATAENTSGHIAAAAACARVAADALSDRATSDMHRAAVAAARTAAGFIEHAGVTAEGLATGMGLFADDE